MGAEAYEKAQVTVASVLRNAKSLFGVRIREALPFSLETIPFETIKPNSPPKYRFIPEATPNNLLTAAEEELKGDLYIILLLALGAGLRRSEIDRLRWSDVDVDTGKIRIVSTKDGFIKSWDSRGAVFIGEKLKDALKAHKDVSIGFYVVSPQANVVNNRKNEYYRCEVLFSKLCQWLRTKGITKNKPLHHLRGIFGDELAKTAGIYAASSQLRHSDITVTRSYYAAGISATPLEL